MHMFLYYFNQNYLFYKLINKNEENYYKKKAYWYIYIYTITRKIWYRIEDHVSYSCHMYIW